MISKVKYLVGDGKIISGATEPFSKEVCIFLDKFSKELNKFKDIRKIWFSKLYLFGAEKKYYKYEKKILVLQKLNWIRTRLSYYSSKYSY